MYEGAETSPHLSMDVFNLSAVGMGIIGPSGFWVRANPAMSEFFGYQQDDVLGVAPHDLVHPDDLPHMRDMHERLSRQEFEQTRVEVRCLRKGGEVVWARHHLTALRVPGREAMYLLVQIEDITELRVLERRHRQRNEYYRAMVQNLPGVVASSFDRDLRYLVVEGQGMASQRLTSEMIEGKSVWEFWGEEYGEQVAGHMRATLAGERRSYESTNNGRDYDVRFIPLPDEDGEINTGLVLNIDVTDLKAAEISKRRRGEVYRAIVRNLPGAIAAVFDRDLHSVVVDGHGLANLGLAGDMLEGASISELWGPESRDRVTSYLLATLDGEPQTFDESSKGRDFDVRTVPILDDDGAIHLGVLIGVDITERKLHDVEMQTASEALARSNRELEEFAVVASHDLRAPLVSLHGLASILADEYRDKLDVEGRYILDRIVVNAEQMQTLLIDLLNISRVGRVDSDFTVVDLGEVVEHVMDQQRFSLQRRDGKLHADLSGITIQANWTRMIQVFSNLIDNAIKYTPSERSPEIEISARDEGDRWLVTVADNGVGVLEDHREDVFGMFHRLRTGKQLNPSGTGMGLALVERIVRLHGGDIWIDPDRAIGTAFHFTFPKIDPDMARPERQGEAEA